MPPELAAQLARTVIVFALDGVVHGAFAQGLGRAEDGVLKLAEERTRQRVDQHEPFLTVIVMHLGSPHSLPSEANTLGHELGHAALGHTHAALTAASGDAREEQEREAE